ncbi:hypothetical protein H4R18_005530 [Coemansia javaensis]|uniref:DUF229 domain-containing protein n=1 Tax=Coemansia javaensis TaxID=2761396 RepID=A0A9W8LF72_9FUNG|nr:hypothetical protein H4R18_005530 [Coemansia javaensis]
MYMAVRSDGGGAYPPSFNDKARRNHSASLRLLQRSSLPARLKSPGVLAFAVLTVVWVTAYVLSLEGGDLVFINEHLGVFGAEIVVCVLGLTAITAMLYMRRFSPNSRRGMVGLTAGIAMLLYVYDHGERFERHGMYNMLVVAVIYVPLNAAIAALYVLFATVPHFPAIFAVGSLCVAGTATIALRHYMAVFGQGTLDRLRDVPGECSWQGRNYPLVDLLPAGTQNFWAGSMHCRPEPIQIEAFIDGAGRLNAACAGMDIFVDVLPETRQWPLSDKSKWNTFNRRVLDRMWRERYTGPMQLENGTQAVVVRCGTSSKIVTRVSPPPSSLPRYSPPADSDTRRLPEGAAPAEAAPGAPDRRPNVVFVFVDATSHRQFYRRLKKSAAVLATLHRPGVTALTELYRYHTLGVSTDNSTRAMYLGEVLPRTQNPLPIWAYFRDRGYITARVETSCEDWARTYTHRHFASQAFSVGNRSLDYELSAPFCMPEFYPATGNAFGNFKGPFSITARCLYGRHVHEYGFDYIDQLRAALRADGRQRAWPYMLMLNLMEGHEATGEVLRTADERLAAFLESMRESGELDDTALFVVADHGLHMGLNFVFLNSGQIEHKNPFFAMVLPQWLRAYVDGRAEPGLAVNEQRLTTPTETHYTLKTLADWPAFALADYARSLFAPVPAERTCEQAGIDAMFCMCR